MQTFLICLAIIVAAFAMALFVWRLFKPKRESVVFIRPHKNSLDLEAKAAANREAAYQKGQEDSRRAAEQNRRDQEAQMLQASRIENQNQASTRRSRRNERISGGNSNHDYGSSSSSSYGSCSSSDSGSSSYESCSSSDSGSSSYSSSSSSSSSD